MSTITYRRNMNLALRVKDTAGFDGFVVFINGLAGAPPVEDRLVHQYTIPRPDQRTVVVVQFGGNDGGASAVYDLSTNQKLERRSGMSHVYVIEPEAAEVGAGVERAD